MPIKKITKAIAVVSLLLALLRLPQSAVQAVSDPPLFSCTTPVGVVIANYSDGTHGIPGDSRNFIGSDLVFRVDGQHLIQCFCPADGGTGTQSNWWKVANLNQNDLDFFIRRGWQFVPNGQLWGLEAQPFLVKNDSFQCGNLGGILGLSTGGEILGASTLAATGNEKAIVLYTTLAILFGWAAYQASQI